MKSIRNRLTRLLLLPAAFGLTVTRGLPGIITSRPPITGTIWLNWGSGHPDTEEKPIAESQQLVDNGDAKPIDWKKIDDLLSKVITSLPTGATPAFKAQLFNNIAVAKFNNGSTQDAWDYIVRASKVEPRLPDEIIRAIQHNGTLIGRRLLGRSSLRSQ